MNAVSADGHLGVKYQETHKRCPPNVVAIEYRLDEKCGKLRLYEQKGFDLI